MPHSDRNRFAHPGAVIRLVFAALVLWSGAAWAQQITVFPNAFTPLTGTEYVPLVQNGKNVKVTVGDLIPGLSNNTPITAAGTNITNSLATWTGYLAGTPNPNPVIFGTSGFGTTTIVPIRNAAVPDASQVSNSLTTSAVGTVGTIKFLESNGINIIGAANMSWWEGFDTLAFSGTGGTGGHVARYAQSTRHTFGAGGSSNNPGIWAMVAEFDDFTNQPSSATSANISIEMDNRGHNVDDANQRIMATGVIAPSEDRPTDYFEAADGYALQVQEGAYVKKAVNIGGNYTTAIMDFRGADSYSQGVTPLLPPPQPTVTANVTSLTVPISNVMPFTSDIFSQDINRVSSSNVVFFADGQSATEVHYTITGSGPTPAGTITLSAPITVASGTRIFNRSNGIWLGTGQSIAFDNGGDTKISSDSHTISLVGNFAVSGSTTMPLTTPSSSSAACAAGMFAIDANFVYVCSAANTWKRAAISTF